MALFHFEIKSDKRKSGNRTSAKEHVTYIDREGKYRDIDQRDLEKVSTENIISGIASIKKIGRELLLYSSPFGTIKLDDSGVKISRNASPQTIATAMLIAKEVYDCELSVRGMEAFKKSAASIAADLELPLQFEKHFSNVVKAAKEKIENDRQQFELAGGKYILPGERNGKNNRGTAKRNDNRTLSECRKKYGSIQPNLAGSSLAQAAKRGFCVPTLSGSSMDVSGRASDVLLSKDEYDDLQRSLRRRQQANPQLRWNVSGPRRADAEMTAKKVMQNLQTDFSKIFAASHVQYINRETRFKQRGGCIKTGSHLPAWADGSAKNFFDAADKYEGKDRERYKEIVFALPNELTLGQQEEILNAFLKKHLSDYYYAWAIHDKIGSMSNGEHHTHVHIMFSTRKIDDYEKAVGRDAQLFFKRASSDAAHPENGGCPKDSKWNGKDRIRFLLQLREDAAKIQNEILEKYGHNTRVDHRSLKARRQEALANGNTFLAEILNRVPEAAVGPNELLNENSEICRTQKNLRKYNYQQFKNKISKNILSCNIETEKNDRLYAANQKSLQEIMQVLNKNDKAVLANDLTALSTQAKEISIVRSTLSSSSEAIEQAFINIMREEQRESWQNFKRLAQEQKHWQQFKLSLKTDAIPDPKLQKDVTAAVDKEIKRLKKELHTQSPTIRKIFEQFSLPAVQKQLQTYAGNKIFSERFARQKLQKLLLKQQQSIANLSQRYNNIVANETHDNGYSAQTIADNIGEELKLLYQQSKEIRNELNKLRPKVISPERAMTIAMNQYVHFAAKGKVEFDFKSIREQRRALQKNQDKGKDTTDILKKIEELDLQEKMLEEKCSSPEGKAKISEIVAGILRKNAPISMRFTQLQASSQQIQVKITSLQEMYAAAKDAARRYPYMRYKMSGMPQSLRSSSHSIAAALAGDAKFTPLVLKSRDEDYDDWELLTEAEKDEMRNKKGR